MKQQTARRSSAEWADLVAEWARSGESAQRFALRRRVNVQTLRWWRSEIRKRKRTGAVEQAPTGVVRRRRTPARVPQFTEVRVVDGFSPSLRAQVEVQLASGIVVRVREGADAPLVSAVIRALHAC
jgi:transposase